MCRPLYHPPAEKIEGEGGHATAGGFTTIQITDLTASTAYGGVQVTATSGETTVTSPVSNAFTSTAS